MSVALTSKCLDMAAYCGVNTAVLIGGEPLLHPNLREIIECAHERSMRVVIVSNGLALRNPSFSRDILKCLFETDELSISIKGFDNQQYSISCDADDGFKMLEEAISNMNEMGVEYSLSYVVSESNMEDLGAGIASISNRLQKPIGLSLCSPCFPESKIKKPATPEQHASLASRALSVLLGSGVTEASLHINAPLCLVDQEQVYNALDCVSIFTGCQVLSKSGVLFDTNGDLMLCNHLLALPVGRLGTDYSSPAEFGSFLTGKTFSSAWEAFVRLPYEKCSNCKELLLCGGGCPLLFY